MVVFCPELLTLDTNRTALFSINAYVHSLESRVVD